MKGNAKLSGTNGQVWINSELLGELEKIQAGVEGKFEEFNQCGSPNTYQSFQGYSGDGTLTLIKESSRGLKMLGDAFKSGTMPEIKIISKLTNASTGKSERTAITGVVFTKFDLVNFEAKGLVKEELPFKFEDYEVLETI